MVTSGAEGVVMASDGTDTAVTGGAVTATGEGSVTTSDANVEILSIDRVGALAVPVVTMAGTEVVGEVGDVLVESAFNGNLNPLTGQRPFQSLPTGLAFHPLLVWGCVAVSGSLSRVDCLLDSVCAQYLLEASYPLDSECVPRIRFAHEPPHSKLNRPCSFWQLSRDWVIDAIHLLSRG